MTWLFGLLQKYIIIYDNKDSQESYEYKGMSQYIKEHLLTSLTVVVDEDCNSKHYQGNNEKVIHDSVLPLRKTIDCQEYAQNSNTSPIQPKPTSILKNHKNTKAQYEETVASQGPSKFSTHILAASMKHGESIPQIDNAHHEVEDSANKRHFGQNSRSKTHQTNKKIHTTKSWVHILLLKGYTMSKVIYSQVINRITKMIYQKTTDIFNICRSVISLAQDFVDFRRAKRLYLVLSQDNSSSSASMNQDKQDTINNSQKNLLTSHNPSIVFILEDYDPEVKVWN